MLLNRRSPLGFFPLPMMVRYSRSVAGQELPAQKPPTPQ